MKPNGQTVFFLLMLMLVGLAFFTNEQTEQVEGEKVTSGSSSGYPEYDMIPIELKHKMDSLKAKSYNISYTYWYYFDIEDVNKHYYLEDDELEVVESLPVTNPAVLAMVDEIIQEKPGRDRFSAHHPAMKISPNASKEERENHYKKYWKNRNSPSWVTIQYLFPEDTIDFSKLRVGIVEQIIPPYTNPAALRVVHPYNEVDTLPMPLRGYAYFEDVMEKGLMQYDVFTFYDLKGKVTVEFTVGSSPSPDIVEGFSTHEDSYEAYQADGAFIKVLNNLKVRWKPGKQGNSPVAVRMPLTFQVDGQTIRLEKTPSATNAIADL